MVRGRRGRDRPMTGVIGGRRLPGSRTGIWTAARVELAVRTRAAVSAVSAVPAASTRLARQRDRAPGLHHRGLCRCIERVGSEGRRGCARRHGLRRSHGRRCLGRPTRGPRCCRRRPVPHGRVVGGGRLLRTPLLGPMAHGGMIRGSPSRGRGSLAAVAHCRVIACGGAATAGRRAGAVLHRAVSRGVGFALAGRRLARNVAHGGVIDASGGLRRGSWSGPMTAMLSGFGIATARRGDSAVAVRVAPPGDGLAALLRLAERTSALARNGFSSPASGGKHERGQNSCQGLISLGHRPASALGGIAARVVLL